MEKIGIKIGGMTITSPAIRTGLKERGISTTIKAPSIPSIIKPEFKLPSDKRIFTAAIDVGSGMMQDAKFTIEGGRLSPQI